MSISARLTDYLAQRGVCYEVCAHHISRSSAQTARTAHVQPGQLAKAVVLEDDAGCVVAVIPADRYVMLGRLGQLLGRHQLHLSDEKRIAALFDDCRPGAVPPFGMAWGLETVVDADLGRHDTVYFEGGDHERLLKVSREQFLELMQAARHGSFSRSPLH